MATDRRVSRLKDMVDRIERLPASPERDRLLSEVRSRAVDLETGVTPRAMLPMREPVAPSAVPRAVRRTAPPGIAPAPHPPARAAGALGRSPAPDEAPPTLDERLSLDDARYLSPPAHRDAERAVVPPWTLGLRG